jgi:two-component system chemotaxis response regulator CheB
MIPLIVIGGSAGGLEPLRTIVRGLPGSLPAAVLVVIHTAPTATSQLPQILSKAGTLPAFHPKDGQLIEPARIYVAPPDHHLTVEDGRARVQRGPRFNAHRPSIDALFKSAAAQGPDVAATLLSGMDADGSMGLQAIKDHGGMTVVQSPEDASFPFMVTRAISVMQPDHVLPSHQIASALVHWSVRSAPEITHGRQDMTGEQDIEDSGKLPSPYSCPDCGGVLWRDPKGDELGYECRVGHAYSLDGLLTEQTQSLENALWTALRALEEKQSLLNRLADDTEARGLMRSAERFREGAEDLEGPSTTLRRLLENNDVYRIPQIEAEDTPDAG